MDKRLYDWHLFVKGIARQKCMDSHFLFQTEVYSVKRFSFTSFIFQSFRRSRGDRIGGVFDVQLPAALRRLPFDCPLSLDNVRKIVSEADGYQPHLIAPEQGYRRLIDGALSFFKGPAKPSVDTVHSMLKEIVRLPLVEAQYQELRPFPTLRSETAWQLTSRCSITSAYKLGKRRYYTSWMSALTITARKM